MCFSSLPHRLPATPFIHWHILEALAYAFLCRAFLTGGPELWSFQGGLADSVWGGESWQGCN